MVFIFSILIAMGFAEDLNLESYDLTAYQAQLLTKWNEEEKYEPSKLYEFAAFFDHANNQPKVDYYIPPHTKAELDAVIDWAEGRAFAQFSRKTKYNYDFDRYENDCPNLALLNFGVATGMEYLRVDVLVRAISTYQTLNWMYVKSPETFSEEFYKLAKARGFDKYMTDPTQQEEVVALEVVASI